MKLKKIEQFLNYKRLNKLAFKLILLFITAFVLILFLQFLSKGYWQSAQATEVNYQSNKSLDLTSNNFQTSGELLLEQGINSYQSQRFAEAIKLWENAIKEFQNNSLKQALVLNYLSLAYQKLGQWKPAESTILQSLELLNAAQSQEKLPILARSLSTYSRLQLKLGQVQIALETLQKATAIYEKMGDSQGKVGSLINQAQALQSLGLYRQALKIFNEVETWLQNQPADIKAVGFLSLGNTLRWVGDLDRSWCVLQRGLDTAKQSNSSQLLGDLFLSLGHTAYTLGTHDKNYYKNIVFGQETRASEVLQNCDQSPIIDSNALGFYHQAQVFYNQSNTQFSISSNANLQISLAQLQVDLSILQVEEWKNQWPVIWPKIAEKWHQIYKQIETLAPSQFSIYSRLNLAQQLIQIQEHFYNQPVQTQSLQSPTFEDIKELLQTSLQHSKKLKDERATSITFGYLGQLYEKKQAWTKAKSFTQAALNLSKSLSQTDLSYQWQWQLGQIFKAQGSKLDAISAYVEAIDLLQDVRQNLVGIDLDLEKVQADFRFNFQEKVEPIYKELVDLLLTSEPTSETLKTVLAVMELYQISEIENFLHCQLPQNILSKHQQKVNITIKLLADKLNQIHQLDKKAALVYPILLKDRVEVIISYPNQTLQHYSFAVSKKEVERVLYNLRQNIENIQNVVTLEQIQVDSQQIYQWLLQKSAPHLAAQGVKTLVFVLDGSLRTIPMSALYNPLTHQYLVETFSTALSPGLLQLKIQEFDQFQAKLLLAGTTNSSLPDFPNQLPAVQKELKEIQALVSNSKLLLNQEFTWKKVKNDLTFSDFSQLHIATHGKFSSTPQQTYLIDFENQPLTLNDLDNLLQSQNQIDLLTLSAGETAEGDNRAILGLAGVAVKSQAISTLAGLWKVDDTPTANLMIEFYQQLKAGQTKAEALRLAQLSLLQTSSKLYLPSSWSAYVIVGNWL